MSPLQLDLGELDLARWLRPGMGVVWGQCCAEPEPLVAALLAQSAAIGPLRGFVGMTWSDLYDNAGDSVTLSSFGAMGRLSRIARSRPVDVIACHFSALPRLFAERILPGDVALVQVAPPGPDGRYSAGVGADYTADAVRSAGVVIAEVNDRMPATFGTTFGPEELDVVVHTSRPLRAAPAATQAPHPAEARIAARIAERVRDGDTLQTGVGSLPEAILHALRGLRGLGVHTGMTGDAVLELVEAGVITGEHKPRDRGLVVTGAALGSAATLAALHGHEAFSFRPVSYTHHPGVASTAGPLVAINGAMEVDLQGQVGAEAIGGHAAGGIGGQVDFLRGAAAGGGTGIVALTSTTSKGESRVVARLAGPVTTGRADVDLIVTEHGTAELRGRTSAARTEAMISIADPAHRDRLTAEARAAGLL